MVQDNSLIFFVSFKGDGERKRDRKGERKRGKESTSMAAGSNGAVSPQLIQGGGGGVLWNIKRNRNELEALDVFELNLYFAIKSTYMHSLVTNTKLERSHS